MIINGDIPFNEVPDLSLNDIDITDDFMFSSIMRDPEICMELLQYLLPEKKIVKIHYHSETDSDGKEIAENRNLPESQKVLQEAIARRGVRLDVFLDDGKTIYDVEMQTTNDRYLAQRTRYYQSRIDADQLDRGAQFDELKPSYVIFICKFDPFGEELYRYTFVNSCIEKAELRLEDGATRLFFNTAGKKGEISAHLKELLVYMNNTKTYSGDRGQNDLIEKIEEAVAIAKRSSEWRRSYMVFEERFRTAELHGEERGEERGIKIGEERGKEQGLKIGEEHGKKEHGIEVAQKMLTEKFPINQIVFLSGLTVEEIDILAKNQKAE